MHPYQRYISPKIYQGLIKKNLNKVSEKLFLAAEPQGLETKQALEFLQELYEIVRPRLDSVLLQREKDREFIDQRCKALYQYNKEQELDLLSDEYQTVLGLTDEQGRIVIGPLDDYKNARGASVADIPAHLRGEHVTLFGPPGKAKMSINAMNSFHRKLKQEPEVIEEILKKSDLHPKWGADDEDSKTPLHSDLTEAAVNLSACFKGNISFEDGDKKYELAKEKLAQPIKRFPGLALPCTFMFYEDQAFPLHLYDFALHFFHHWYQPEALTFYVPKLENEEEAAYVKLLFDAAEKLILKRQPTYIKGSIRCIIVLENPRAVFRVNEIMDELYPYFAGASLGWHDYLGSTARLLKEDGNYRIPVKADPDIVIKYIKASHELLADVVGERGGIKIGGMYGILPLDNDIFSDSFQMTLRGYFRDVVTQMKRNLSGFWVAHPDFVRLGMAIVEAWKNYQSGHEANLKSLVDSLLKKDYAKEVWSFILADDIPSLDKNHKRYDRALIVADIKESEFIANNDPEEIRYNVFQSLQYLTDWLSGNGCVALPAHVGDTPVRVMDDLATAERSRWEVWHELYHGRFELIDFIKIAHEEMDFIRKNKSTSKKKVQVGYTPENAKWYDCAFTLMLKMMSDEVPVEFATELLMPFTLTEIRESESPLEEVLKTDAEFFRVCPKVEQLNYYFSQCGCRSFALQMASIPIYDEQKAKDLISHFTVKEIKEAASFHGNIGESKAGLDKMASSEQAGVSSDTQEQLLDWGERYWTKFGFKFLVSAKGKTGNEMLSILQERFENSVEKEIDNAREALWQITKKRISQKKTLKSKLTEVFGKSSVEGLQLAITQGQNIQTLCFGSHVKPDSSFEVASLSKTIASTFSLELFKLRGISLEASVNGLLHKYGSNIQLDLDCQLVDLMRHTALNMHYVKGFEQLPPVEELLKGLHGYDPVRNLGKPGKSFHYSGAGFLVLEHLIELIEGEDYRDKISHWLDNKELSFEPTDKTLEGRLDTKESIALRFPAFAAGMYGTARGYLSFLKDHVACADSEMFYGVDFGAKEFMGALAGLGTFVAEAGANRLLIHQGANDGYRSLYLYCHLGPNKGFGLVAFSQGELEAVKLIGEIVQKVLVHFTIEGVDKTRFQSSFKAEGHKAEEVVNKGYKELIFDAFKRDRAEEITYIRPVAKNIEQDILQGCRIVSVTNDRFARIENLFSPYEPWFDPKDFGTQGKIMDSWETPRHNIYGHDQVELELVNAARLKSVEISTKYHLGNQVSEISIETLDGQVLLDRLPLKGHALKIINLKEGVMVQNLRVKIFPDGGLTRLRFYSHDQKEMDRVFTDEIGQTLKPLSLDYAKLPKSRMENLCDFTHGARILSVSDEHYSPAETVLSPLAPLNMFDGFESARSREAGHYEELIITLTKKSAIELLEFDFTYFINNNPLRMSVFGLCEGEWVELVHQFFTKPYAGEKLGLPLKERREFEQLKVHVYPDGGFNRIRAYAPTHS